MKPRVLPILAALLAGPVLGSACDGDDVSAPPFIQQILLSTGDCSNLQEGRTCQLDIVVLDSEGEVVEEPRLQWRSSSIVLATVSASGVVTGLREGSVTITASTLSGAVSDQTSIFVRPAPGGGLPPS